MFLLLLAFFILHFYFSGHAYFLVVVGSVFLFFFVFFLARVSWLLLAFLLWDILLICISPGQFIVKQVLEQ